jgi:hypothetical protein
MMIQIQRPVRFIWSALPFTAAGLFVAGIIGFIQWIYLAWRGIRVKRAAAAANANAAPAEGARPRWWIEAALLEAENNTYSLSRAQFLWWLAIITWGYLFLFLGQGWVGGKWAFPPLGGFSYTFLISLGTACRR